MKMSRDTFFCYKFIHSHFFPYLKLFLCIKLYKIFFGTKILRIMGSRSRLLLLLPYLFDEASCSVFWGILFLWAVCAGVVIMGWICRCYFSSFVGGVADQLLLQQVSVFVWAAAAGITRFSSVCEQLLLQSISCCFILAREVCFHGKLFSRRRELDACGSAAMNASSGLYNFF